MNRELNISAATNDHVVHLKRLWKQCFFDEDSFIDWNFENRFSKENTFVMCDENDIPQVMAQIIPYEMKISEKIHTAGYIEGVATSPDFRMMGYSKKLILKLFKTMYHRDEIFSFLVPFNYKFYEKLGFATSHYFKKLDIAIKETPNSGIFDDGDLNINCKWKTLSLDNYTISIAKQIYYEFIENMDFTIQRSNKNFHNILQEAFMCNYNFEVFNDGTNRAYILYKIQDGKIDIQEIAYTSHKAFKYSMAYIYKLCYNENIKSFSALLPKNSINEYEFSDLRDAISLKPFAMSRIINALPVLKLFTHNLSTSEEIKLKVLDEFCPWNSKIFCISQNNVKISEDNNYNLLMDINTLTALVCGVISVKDCINLEKINPTTKETCILEKMFYCKNSYLNCLFN